MKTKPFPPLCSRFHDKVVIEEELEAARKGTDWEVTKADIRGAKQKIEQGARLKLRRSEDWNTRNNSSLDLTESTTLRNGSRDRTSSLHM